MSLIELATDMSNAESAWFAALRTDGPNTATTITAHAAFTAAREAFYTATAVIGDNGAETRAEALKPLAGYTPMWESAPERLWNNGEH